jgi:hypothetical protein
MSSDKTDEDWLMALDGKSRPFADRAAVQEALAVRRAFKRIEARRKDKMAPATDRSIGIQGQSGPPLDLMISRSEGVSFGDVRFSRRRRGIFSTDQAQDEFLLRERGEYEQTRAALRRAGLLKDPAPRNVKMWAIAASILAFAVLGVNVPYEDDESWDRKSVAQRVFYGTEPPLARGEPGSAEIGSVEGKSKEEGYYRRSADGEKNISDLVDGLRREGFRLETKNTRRGLLLLRVESSIVALQYLQGRGVDTRNVAGGWIYIESSSLPLSIQKRD